MRDPAQWFERLTVTAKAATVLGSIHPQTPWIWDAADEAVLKKSLFCVGSLQRFSTHCICVSVSVLVSESIYFFVWHGKPSILHTAGYYFVKFCPQVKNFVLFHRKAYCNSEELKSNIMLCMRDADQTLRLVLRNQDQTLTRIWIQVKYSNIFSLRNYQIPNERFSQQFEFFHYLMFPILTFPWIF